MRAQAVQRVRVTYGVAGPARYLSVLDMGRLWERLLRRAGVPLAYTQGYSPHPRMQFAAALPVGYESVCELLDLFLAQPRDPRALGAAISAQCPQGLTMGLAEVVPLQGPAPQALVRAACYSVSIWSPASGQEVRAAQAALLVRPAISRLRRKKGEMNAYDLRPLIHELSCLPAPGPGAAQGADHELEMLLACGQGGAGRPEEILAELGLTITHQAVRRTRLIWEQERGSAP